ncbi:MAG: sugar transferase [Rhodospirillales bacterium]|nr:sugar transferase [Rhodospirillales bacterium]
MVVVALPVAASERLADLRAVLEEVPVTLGLFVPGGEAAVPGAGGGRLLALADVPIGGAAGVLKRAEDLLLGGLALLLAALPMLLIALAIKVESPGPVLFRQTRTGRGGRVFQVLKFRTMQHHLADPGARTQARAGDCRLTRLGAWLRRSSADELPQLINVLRGEMSLVGPRPHAPGTRAGDLPFELADEHYAARHRVRPGITGLAQVRGLRGPTETEEKLRRRVAADLEYIERWSIWLDLWVLARTAASVLAMRNAL